MFDLISPQAPAPGALTTTEIEAVRDFAEAEKAASTRLCYERDWRIFRAWCAFRHLAALPAEPATVAGFLAAQAHAGVRPSSLGRRLAALAYAHKLAGVTEPPTNSRRLGTAPDQKAPATAEVVSAMLKHCPPEKPIGARDRALKRNSQSTACTSRGDRPSRGAASLKAASNWPGVFTPSGRPPKASAVLSAWSRLGVSRRKPVGERVQPSLRASRALSVVITILRSGGSRRASLSPRRKR
jgi:hypothetical protein